MFFPTTTSRNIEFGETSGLQENSFCCRLLISSPDTRSGDLHFGSFGIVKFCNQWCNSNMWQSQYQPFWCKVISLKRQFTNDNIDNISNVQYKRTHFIISKSKYINTLDPAETLWLVRSFSIRSSEVLSMLDFSDE